MTLAIPPAPDGALVDSRSSGYISPVGAPPPDDAALCALFQPTIVGITGLAGNLVRRRGQSVPGSQPSRDTTWCSFMVTTTSADINPTIIHDGAAACGYGEDIVMRSEELEISVSFYGPYAGTAATTLREGLGLGQNRARLRSEGIAYVGIDRFTLVPDLTNGQNITRADLVLRARRMALRRYPIRNVIAVAGCVVADSGADATEHPVIAPLFARS